MAILVADDLWAVVEPRLPRASEQAAMAGILFALRTGIAGVAAGQGHPGLEPGSAQQREPARERGRAEVGPNPTNRGKPGTKRHAEGTPLGPTLSAANRHNSRMLAPTLDAVPGVRARRRGRPRRRPTRLHAM